MARFKLLALFVAITALGTQMSYPSTVPSVPSDQTAAVTFNKDVLPVLQKNCQSCHRPGEIAPMSFLTYESTRPWAKAIKTAVLGNQMPPWFADPQVGKFRNAPKITPAEIKTLVSWADTGASEGNAADKPAPVQWVKGWRTQPDREVAMPTYSVAAQGAGEIKEFLIPNPFQQDTLVSSIEIRPGDPSVVHHVILQVVDPTRDAQLRSAAGLSGIRVSNPQGGGSLYSNDLFAKFQELKTFDGSFMTMEAVYAPGTTPQDFGFLGSSKLVKGGGQLRVEIHYTPNGKVTTDQTRIGFTLAKNQGDRRFVLMAPEHMVNPTIPIEPGDANWETSGEITFKQDAELVWFMPHMHLRGKDMTFQLVYPDDRVETVLNAKYNFNWQLGYEVAEPIKVPKGTRMVITAHHDNSSNNPSNPNATQNVAWGDLTGQEMMLPWFGVVVDKDVPPSMIARYNPRNLVMDDTLRALDRLISSGFDLK